MCINLLNNLKKGVNSVNKKWIYLTVFARVPPNIKIKTCVPLRVFKK